MTENDLRKVLLIGIGNEYRSDDLVVMYQLNHLLQRLLMIHVEQVAEMVEISQPLLFDSVSVST